MSKFVETKTEYKINREALQLEFDKNTSMNVFVSYDSNPRDYRQEDYSKVDIYFTQNIVNHNGNEMSDEEFEYHINITAKEIAENENFVNDVVKAAEEKFKEYYLGYCKEEIAFLTKSMKEYEED